MHQRLRWVGALACAAGLCARGLLPAQARGSRTQTHPLATVQQAFAAVHDSLRLYYVGRPVGWERYDFTSDASGLQLTADFDYVDRGRRNRIQSTMLLDARYAPKKLDVARVADTARTPVTRVDVVGRHATVWRNGKLSDVVMPAVAFAISPYQPLSQHLALLRYWMAHGAPATLSIVPGGPVNTVAIKRAGVDTLGTGSSRILLTRYTIDGVVWGLEYLWIDAQGRIAMFASAAGGLSMKGVQAELVPLHAELMAIASRSAVNDMVAVAARTKQTARGDLQRGEVALVGATLVDGTGQAAIPNATVIVNHGKIVAAGPSATTKVPAGARRVDVTGKTIVPGLWDSHAHLHQLEWTLVYLAAGVTTVRDMGNELPFITDLRHAIESGRAAGPNIITAGLVDGPGPNAFGALSASTPEEGREIVRKYHDLGFEQIKLYSLLSPAVVGAICDEAHQLGMTVTGHIPTSLSLQAAIDSGMDQVAHQPIRGDADSLNALIPFLKQHNTVIDPTASWNEIGGHSQAEPLQNFQPVTQHLPPVFMQTRAASWGANVDSATAHSRLARSLAITKALHDAGIPIVVGTDEGVPAFSVYREMELYVQAGFTPMDALRAATAVPAKAMGREKDLGTIEAGKIADLLVLDANPLERISNIRSVHWVMKGGALYESAALWTAVGFVP
ncbi:MAG: amidohydrolase family protein [Gemmatimonas sp.]